LHAIKHPHVHMRNGAGEAKERSTFNSACVMACEEDSASVCASTSSAASESASSSSSVIVIDAARDIETFADDTSDAADGPRCISSASENGSRMSVTVALRLVGRALVAPRLCTTEPNRVTGN
jgi:hypothetical protein